ncbi:protein virilizer homolog [Haliotis rubra]|uniref:protein virilizer homolog n=1 Tax=Haliotis rubra TaxID=36100 RepID=UPI001EE55AF7|nr:protein virilizer homolog [Haliotis rubra]
MLEKFATRILAVSEQDFNSRLTELEEWVAPLKKVPCVSRDKMSDLIGQLKMYAEDVHKLPPGLITTVRILHYLSVPPEKLYTQDSQSELKYMHALVELYSEECFPIFLSFLQKLSESLLRRWQKGIRLSNDQMSRYLAITQPSLSIVKRSIAFVIEGRETEFKDLTALPALFELHTVLCSVPISVMHSQGIAKIQKDIVDAILAYTQPALNQAAATEEGLAQSLWTMMLTDLLKYAKKLPYTYLSGLIMMSELLPLPLPLQTKEPLDSTEKSEVVMTRKLWSAHLHPLSSLINDLIKECSGSSCQPLQQMLCRVCWQLADLASPSATMITRCLLDIIIENSRILW